MSLGQSWQVKISDPSIFTIVWVQIAKQNGFVLILVNPGLLEIDILILTYQIYLRKNKMMILNSNGALRCSPLQEEKTHLFAYSGHFPLRMTLSERVGMGNQHE